jgi:hypothetical protein
MTGWRWAIGGAAAIVIIIVVVLVLVLSLGGSSGKASASVLTEPTNTAKDPFAPPMGTTDQTVSQPIQAPSNYQASGNHVGLYGGTLNIASCDKTQLTSFLQTNPDKGAAWASTLGITQDQIPTYINSLTPVILRSDTLVTNHGFVNGQANSFPAVLQAGTAVLVNDKGEPVTKCYCGNPLTTPPSYSSPPTYYGPHWTGWNGGNNYTTVTSSSVTINVFVLVDITTNQTIYLQAGGSVPTTNPTGARTTPTATTVPRTTTTVPRTTTTFPTTTSMTHEPTTTTHPPPACDPVHPVQPCTPQ